jgi:exonuclease SbcC
MIPIHLSIQGLYSYQDRQEVDFTRLTEAGLFGIFGAVGSGKTTILEAMSLCLYGRTERFNLSGDDRYYNMLNLKVNEGVMSFTFLAGSDSKKFRADIKLRRNRNKYEDVKLLQHSYYLFENGMDPIPVDQSLVLAAVGISYDNFKRTLVIPQGQFREFLELKPKDRTEMLKELFGLHRFDKAARVNELASVNKSSITEKEGGLLQLADATEEALQSLRDRLTEVNESSTEWQLKLAERATALQTIEFLKQTTDSLNHVIEQRAVLAAAASNDASMLHRIERYENLRERYAALLRDLDILFGDLQTKQTDLDRMNALQGQKSSALADATEAWSQASSRLEQAEALAPRAAELGRMAELKSLSININDLQRKIVTEQDRIQNGLEKVAEEERLAQQKRDQIQEWLPVIMDEKRAFDLRLYYRDLDRFMTTQARDEQLLTMKLVAVGKTQDSFDAQCEQIPQRMHSYVTEEWSEEGVHNMMNGAVLDILRDKEQLRNQLTSLAIRKELRHYAMELVEGEPCVLCGSVHHPAPLHAADANEEEQSLQQKLNDLDAEELNIRNYTEGLKGAIRTHGLSNREAMLADQQAQASRTELQAHRENFHDDIFKSDDRQAFDRADKASEDAKRAVRDAQAAIITYEGNIKAWSEGIEKIKTIVQQASIDLAGMQGRFDISVQLILHLDVQQYLERDVQLIEQEQQEILASIETAKTQRVQAEQQKLQLDRDLQELTGRIVQLTDNLNQMNKSLAEKRGVLEVTLSEDGLSDQEVREVLSWNPDLVAIRRDINERRNQLAIIEGQIKTLEAQLAGRTYDEQQHQEAQIAFAEADTHVRNLAEERGATDRSIQKMMTDLKARRGLEAELDALRIRGKDIATLQEMFRASGFVQFMSQRYLENVVAVANKRFRKMVRDKFSIELSPDGDFLVRDYLNDGKTRLLKSLSGGQTFQAALCLALALSENIQHTAGADQHFFFIDEGFGSLDSNSLEMVFATLQSLQHENKAVGVISHVAELQEGMDIYLHVENDPETGTRVRESWRDLS